MRIGRISPKHTAQPIGAIKKKAKADPVKVSASRVADIARIVPPIHMYQKTAPSRKTAETISKIFARTIAPAKAKRR